MKIFLRYLVFFLLCDNSFAQRSPTDIELKSQYCIEVLQDSLKSQKELTEKTGESIFQKQFQQKTEQNLSRLREYLIPRVDGIKIEALILAANRAKKDKENYLSCSPQCKDINTMGNCLATCSERIGNPLARLHSCNEINFLPF